MENTKKLLENLSRKGIRIWIEDGKIRYQAPKSVMNQQILSKLKEQKQAMIQYFQLNEEKVQFEQHPEDRYEEFPLTNIQNSYVVGRNRAYNLGNVTCHGYIEITYEEELDHKKLEEAWNKVIFKHDMLRVIVYPEGYQKVQAYVPYVNIPYYDLRACDDITLLKEEEFIRSIYAEKQYELGTWPLCDIVLSVRNGKSVIHFSLDMLITDFMSANLILDDLDRYYHGEPVEPVVATLYRDIVIHNKKLEHQKSEKRKKDEQYWSKKIVDMGAAPELIVDFSEEISEKVAFEQVKYFIHLHGKESITRFAQQMKVTPSTLILAAFSEIINRWSKNSKFCINLTILNRDKSIPDIEKVVGDFTDVSVLSLDYSEPKCFKDRIMKIQMDLWEDLQHSSVSGIEVLRDLGRSKKENIIIPVVYTSTLGVTNSDDSFLSRSHISYKISQTPQVWIDCQIAEENDGITVNWDYRTGIFNHSVIKQMFQAFCRILDRFSKEEYDILDRYDPVDLPVSTNHIRNKVNNVAYKYPDALLTDGFVNSLKLYPNKTALITKEGEYTYHALAQYVATVKEELLNRGLTPGSLVAIMLSKGVWQIASVLGTLMVGGVYLPIDPMQPAQRRSAIIEDSGVKYIFTEKNEEIICNDDLNIINILELNKKDSYKEIVTTNQCNDEPAYIIHTSGTTAQPKGVVVTHKAAINTIFDINSKFGINKNDVFLGLANLAFDLSVYDIFGSFAVGGTLVLPDDKLKKNPKHILDLLIIHKVTVWNSVPAQMKMLVTYMDGLDSEIICGLKVVLMSGDWIPVDLPESIYQKIPGVRVISLGGATEAAIWSIYYEVPIGYEKKNSIPYGYPLSNQKFYILNAGLQNCPDGVPGDLYIAGEGLAVGYFKDEKLTREKFLYLKTEERIYKTGDVGKYDENGMIEFLGRSDNQVKIRGHRIELSEIDSILSDDQDIQEVVSVVLGNAQEDMYIATVIVPKKKEMFHDIYIREDELKNIDKCESELTQEIDRNLLPLWIETANKVVLSDIFLTLYNKGIFHEESREYSFKEIINQLNVPEKLHKLMSRWLNVLCKENIIIHSENGGYKVNSIVAIAYSDTDLWKTMYAVEDKLHYSKKLLDYLKTSSSMLPELMAGKEDPLNLLFPKGEMDVAMAAYHDNIINKIMNGLAKAEISYLAKYKIENSIKVLEVGAGVGGTSVDVIPALDGTGAEYYFTDLSTFFLNHAKEKFGQYEWVKYGIFDINVDVIEQKYKAFSFDIILAANVLHNAKNIHDVFENLKKLLKPNGRMIILEETRESYTLLTSMEFKDGLTGFTDEREENNQTFFTRKQWEDIFEQNNAEIIYEFPQKGDILEMAGQTVYVIRFKEAYARIKKERLLDKLEQKLPEYMVPSQVLFVPELPQTSNGKIDRKKIAEWFSDQASDESNMGDADLPQTGLEKEIAKIWCKELNVDQIGRNDNFYLVGGDSLLIAQVIAKMREKIIEARAWQWDDLLKEMMKVPTIRGIAKSLTENRNNVEKDKSLVVIKEPLQNRNKVTVVFHAGTGTLTPYHSLIAYINERSGEGDAVYGFTFGDEAEYLAIPTEKIFKVLGEKYGKILAELGYSEYVLIGHCVGGLIALETAQYLQKHDKNVSSVTLLSTSIPHKKKETVLAELPQEIFYHAVQTSLYNELLLERTFARLIDANIQKAGHKVDNSTLQRIIEFLIFNHEGQITVKDLCSLKGEFAEAGEEFTRLADMSATERMNDLYATIERPNGQLMEHQRKMLNVLFRVFAQNFRCVSFYEPPLYSGKLRVFNCEDAIANFFPSLFSEDQETWEPYAKNDFYFGTMKGDHISCMNHPYIEYNAKKILDFSK